MKPSLILPTLLLCFAYTATLHSTDQKGKTIVTRATLEIIATQLSVSRLIK